jgi:NAD(P)-dependent dehydrogenase (short-subunit alcohol dehydrogenase family)
MCVPSEQAGTHQAQGWGRSNYGLSKLALIAATKVLAREHPGTTTHSTAIADAVMADAWSWPRVWAVTINCTASYTMHA